MANISRLYGTTTYLIGCMDRVPDGGITWRRKITPFLNGLGIVVFDPCNKPTRIGIEDEENRRQINQWKTLGQFDEVAKAVKLIRIIDLRMVDISDFIICYLDTDVHATGTYEELFWANRTKKPILIVCKQGKAFIPSWLFGVIPHQHMFDDFEQLQNYLCHVNSDEKVEHYKRWVFFDHKRLIPK